MSKIVLPGEPMVDGPTLVRPWRDSDLGSVVEACRDPEIARWTTAPENYSEADARAYLLYRYDALLAGTTAPFAVVSPSDQLLGSIALLRLDWQHQRAEAGYWLAAWGRGDGHATRALGLISRWGFETLGLGRIDLYAATGNAPSQRVAERAGFVREGILRAYMRGKEGQQDMVAFGLLASETEESGHPGGRL